MTLVGIVDKSKREPVDRIVIVRGEVMASPNGS